MTEPHTLLASMLDGYIARDAGAMGAVLAEDVRVWVTNAEGGVDPLQGRELVIGALLSLEAPVFHIEVTQMVRVSDVQALAMVEIRAERNGKSLHNFSSFLARTEADRIAELWMVEALPAYSAEFWS